MLRYALPLLLCLAAACVASYVVRRNLDRGRNDAALKVLADRAIDLALSHREIESDKTLAKLVMQRAVVADDRLPADLLLLAEAHMEQSPSLAWAIADEARAARKQLP